MASTTTPFSQHGQTPAKSRWERWKIIARKIGNFQARVILTVFYFSIALPFGVVYRLVSDPLSVKRRGPQWWVRDEPPLSLERFRQQY